MKNLLIIFHIYLWYINHRFEDLRVEWNEKKNFLNFERRKLLNFFHMIYVKQFIVKFDLYIFTVELIHLLKKIRFWKIRTPGSIIVETPVVILDLESAVRSSMIMFLVLLLVLTTSSTRSRVSRSKQSDVNIQIQVQQRYLVREVRIVVFFLERIHS